MPEERWRDANTFVLLVGHRLWGSNDGDCEGDETEGCPWVVGVTAVGGERIPKFQFQLARSNPADQMASRDIMISKIMTSRNFKSLKYFFSKTSIS